MMSAAEQTVVQDTPNLVFGPAVPTATSALGTAPEVLRAHWPEYLMEAALLSAFMVSVCLFGVLYEFPNSPVHQAIHSSLIRRMLMGVSMGLTAIAIIYSPWGKQSAAHINPSVTFTFFRLGKIKLFDTLCYIIIEISSTNKYRCTPTPPIRFSPFILLFTVPSFSLVFLS